MPTKTSKILWFEFDDGSKVYIKNGKLVLKKVDVAELAYATNACSEVPIRAVDEDDKKEYHGRDCMNCKKHHIFIKDTGKQGVGPDGLYHTMITENHHWCDARGEEIPETDIKLTNYCPGFEEIKHE